MLFYVHRNHLAYYDGESRARTATSTFAQFLSSENSLSLLLFLFSINVALRPRTPPRLIRGTGSSGPERQPRLPHSPRALKTVVVFFFFQCCLTSTETTRLIRDGEPRTMPATSTLTQLLSSEKHNLLGCMYLYRSLTSAGLNSRSQ